MSENTQCRRCVNLKELCGDRYRLDVEESYYAERPEFRRQEEPWLTHIVCEHGTIGVWGGSLLVASTNTSSEIASRLKRLRFARVAQDGSDGVNVVFDVKHLADVAEIMRPRRRRKLSDQQRQRLIEAGAKFRFSAGAHADSEAQICDGEGEAA